VRGREPFSPGARAPIRRARASPSPFPRALCTPPPMPPLATTTAQAALVAAVAAAAARWGAHPATWAVASAATWGLYLVQAQTGAAAPGEAGAPPGLTPWDRRAAAWGIVSAALLANFCLVYDRDFTSW